MCVLAEGRQNLGLCDESVSVASKVLLAACRLLIHIRRGWLESAADDTERCRGAKEERRKRERGLTSEREQCAGLIPDVSCWQNKNTSSISLTATPWLLFIYFFYFKTKNQIFQLRVLECEATLCLFK